MNYNNLKRIPEKEHKELINAILLRIKQVCEDNDITYYLAFGTLLGAVRHKGFIPWDDDIDIAMTRDEYYRFRNIFNELNTRYQLVDLSIKDSFDSPLPKVIDTTTVLSQTQVFESEPIGVYVDVFILDNVPNNKMIRSIYYLNLTTLQKLWSFIRYKRAYSKLSPLYYFYIGLRTIIKPISVARLLDRYSQRFNKYETNYFGHNNHSANRFKLTFEKKWFAEGTYVEFEGEQYCAAKDWNSYLTCLYGNYMQFPPVEERISTHVFDAFYCDDIST